MAARCVSKMRAMLVPAKKASIAKAACVNVGAVLVEWASDVARRRSMRKGVAWVRSSWSAEVNAAKGRNAHGLP